MSTANRRGFVEELVKTSQHRLMERDVARTERDEARAERDALRAVLHDAIEEKGLTPTLQCVALRLTAALRQLLQYRTQGLGAFVREGPMGQAKVELQAALKLLEPLVGTMGLNLGLMATQRSYAHTCNNTLTPDCPACAAAWSAMRDEAFITTETIETRDEAHLLTGRTPREYQPGSPPGLYTVTHTCNVRDPGHVCRACQLTQAPGEPL